jgi:predicted RNase H-like HicB family nuclease
MSNVQRGDMDRWHLTVKGARMRTFTAIVEKCSETNLYVGSVPGFPGAHSQGETLDELNQNLHEVVTMLLEDGDPNIDQEFIGIQTVKVA